MYPDDLDDDSRGNRLIDYAETGVDGNTEAESANGEFLAFAHLDPNSMLNALEAAGLKPDGRVSALNSYENRVYQVGMEDGPSKVTKFYRPGRWTDDAILEEHAFTEEIAALDVPAVCAETLSGKVLHRHEEFRFTVYPSAGGRPPELDNPVQLEVIGRSIARLHNAGALDSFKHRLDLDPVRIGDDSIELLLQSSLMPPHVNDVYEGIATDVMSVVHERCKLLDDCQQLRLHGDFHPGNILWGSDETPNLLDFDDCITGPAIQDLWMFLSGDHDYGTARLADLLEGYTQFREFDPAELALIEPLRALRQIHHAAWIARRWQDPAFQSAFPYFAEDRFWDSHVLALREQRAALDEPVLRWD